MLLCFIHSGQGRQLRKSMLEQTPECGEALSCAPVSRKAPGTEGTAHAKVLVCLANNGDATVPTCVVGGAG